MPSLSDKLKALGVKVGATEISPPKAQRFPTLEQALNGQARQTHLGETFVVEAFYPTGQPYGNTHLAVEASLEGLATWANAPGLPGLPPQALPSPTPKPPGCRAVRGLRLPDRRRAFEDSHFTCCGSFAAAPGGAAARGKVHSCKCDD
jgi:hypothetical protein